MSVAALDIDEADVATPLVAADDLRLITTAAELGTRIDALRERGCHVIAPAANTPFLAQSFGVALTVIDVDSDPSAGQVYNDPTLMRPDLLALSRMTLQFVSLAAGIAWLPSSQCTSDPRLKLLWQFRADAVIRAYDGQMLPIQGTAEVDLRDGSPQLGGWSPSKWRYLVGKNEAAMKRRTPRESLVWSINEWDEAKVLRTRRFGLRLAETKAKSAAIRAMGLKASYTLEELERPFVVARVIYIPDMTDREIRLSVHQHAMQATAVLYGSRG